MSSSQPNESIDPDYRQPDWYLPYEQPSVQSSGYYPYPERLPHSLCGIISFILAIAFAVVLFILVCICSYIVLEFPEAADQDPPHWGFVLAGLGLFGGCLAELLALILGVIGLCHYRTQKVFALCDIGFSIMTLLMVIGLIVLGIIIG